MARNGDVRGARRAGSRAIRLTSANRRVRSARCLRRRALYEPRMLNARRLVAAFVLGVACGPSGPPPLAPAGIAELVLPADGDTLRRIAAEDDPAGRLERRRTVVAGVDRQLLMPAPDDALVPELFDVVVALAPRMESGAV